MEYYGMKDKVFVITGSASGMGRATALLLSKVGGKPVLVDMNEDGLKETQTLCSQVSGTNYKPVTIKANLTKLSDLDLVLTETKKGHQRVDVLVNNAGIIKNANLESSNLVDVYEATFAINVRAPLILSQLFAAMLIESKGCIINISSFVSLKPAPNLLVYGMSKSALTSLTKNLAFELGPKGVRVNEILPGLTDTAIFNDMPPEDRLKHLEVGKSRTLTGEMTEVEDIAETVLFLCSSRARKICGQSLAVDCGSSIK